MTDYYLTAAPVSSLIVEPFGTVEPASRYDSCHLVNELLELGASVLNGVIVVLVSSTDVTVASTRTMT